MISIVRHSFNKSSVKTFTEKLYSMIFILRALGKIANMKEKKSVEEKTDELKVEYETIS